MNLKHALFVLLEALILLPAVAQNKATIHVDLGKEKINPEIYVHFAEHL